MRLVNVRPRWQVRARLASRFAKKAGLADENGCASRVPHCGIPRVTVSEPQGIENVNVAPGPLLGSAQRRP